MKAEVEEPPDSSWRLRLYEIVFEAETKAGRFFDLIVMILGYGIIAVPTGIVIAELTRSSKGASTQVCPERHAQDHDSDAVFCQYCASRL